MGTTNGIDAKINVDVGDDEVRFEFTVTNTSDTDFDLSFSDTQQYDFVVLDDGNEVWRWSTGMMFAQMIQNKTLESGKSVTFEEVWAEPKKGDYEVVATLEARNADVEARETFSF